MRIIIILNGILSKNSPLSGGDLRPLYLAKHWQQAGHVIEIVGAKAAVEVAKQSGVKAQLNEIPVSTQQGSKWGYFQRAFQVLFWKPPLINDAIIYSSNDAIFDVLPAVYMKLKNPQSKWAAVVHWLPPWPPWKRENSSVLSSLLFFINQRVSLFFIRNCADTILAVSESTKKQLYDASVNKKKIQTVICGVDLEAIRAALSLKTTYDAVFMKRLQRTKGIFDLVPIWQEVLKVKPTAKLGVIGGGPDEAEFRETIHEAGLDDKIILLGQIHDATKKYRILKSAKLFVLPTYEENWAIVIGEALAAGLPVISYDLRELRTVWGNHITYIKKGDTKKLATTIVQQLRKPILTKETKQFVEKLDWTVIANQELKIFSDL